MRKYAGCRGKERNTSWGSIYSCRHCNRYRYKCIKPNNLYAIKRIWFVCTQACSMRTASTMPSFRKSRCVMNILVGIKDSGPDSCSQTNPFNSDKFFPPVSSETERNTVSSTDCSGKSYVWLRRDGRALCTMTEVRFTSLSEAQIFLSGMAKRLLYIREFNPVK